MNAAELAQAALSSEPLTRALLLSEWIGGGRELTSSGVLRPAVAREACEMLGIDLPGGTLRSAKTVPGLQLPWEVAIAAGLIEVTQKRARAASDVDVLLGAAEGTSPLPPDLAGRATIAWLRGVGLSMGFPDDVCPACLTVLHELSLVTRPTETGTLVDAVLESEGAAGEDEDRAADDLAAHVEGTIAFLARFDAAFTGPGRTTGGTVTLTPSGRLLATSVLNALTPPAHANAAEITTAVAGLPPKIMAVVTADWTAARTPDGAIRELLACAEENPALRLSALELAEAQGPEGLSAWREAAERPGFGAYARHFLAGIGESVPAVEGDAAWLLVDTLAMAAAGPPSPSARFALMLGLEQLAGDPDFGAGERALEAEDRRKRPESEAHQDWLLRLKITLRGISRPPVWRRVLVPASITLDTLHQVIAGAMGWSGGHMHSFDDDVVEYGPLTDNSGLDLSLDLGLAVEDESETQVRDVLRSEGGRLIYTYDFGDDWVHAIKLERLLPPDGALPAVPVCLAGNGACPPEDCGGSAGYTDLKYVLADPEHEDHETVLKWLGLASASDFDAAAFSPDEATARLRHIRV